MKKELIQVIMEQRELLDLLFNSLEDENKKELKDKTDLAVWNRTFS